MQRSFRSLISVAGVARLTATAVTFALLGCAGGTGPLAFRGSPFPIIGDDGSGGGGGGIIDGGSGGSGGGGGGTPVEPCDETDNRKFLRVSMRNLSSDDIIHYFVVFVAFIDEEGQEGSVCPDDIELYTRFGYRETTGAESFGSLCIPGHALIYFHEEGQFQSAGGAGGTTLASAIGPAQGTSPTFDAFFSSTGALVPVPDWIIFHNPGSGAGQSLKISPTDPEPCNVLVTGGVRRCTQDAFYYVGDTDIMVGSTGLGTGSGRRVPGEIQDTGCDCLGNDFPGWELAASGTTAANAQCNAFLRGGTVEVAFLRDDTNPPYPQAVWRVTDASGAVVHDFDPRANVP